MSISSTASRSRLPPNFPPSAGPAASQQYAYQQQPQDRVPSSGSSQGGPNPSQQYQQGPAYQGSSAPSTSTQYSTYAPSSAGASVAGRDRLPSLSSATSGSASGIKPAAGSAMGDDERREIARVYWAELGDFLVDFLKREPPNARINAREKLTRLSKQQFHELSTDVYDELVRRRTDDQTSVPYLPVKQEFHPKRNAARQKLASLTKNRFKDLASDVYYELLRRNPSFRPQQEHVDQQEELDENESRYDATASGGRPPSQASSASAAVTRTRSASVSSDQQQYRPQPQMNPYFPPTPSPTPQQAQQSAPPPPQQQQHDRSGSVSTSASHSALNNNNSTSRHLANGSISSVASLRGPPLQVVNDNPPPPSSAAFPSHARQASYSRPTVTAPSPASPGSSSSHDYGRSQQHPKQSVTTATVVPAKSTMALESIQVPFSRDSEYITSDGGGPPSPGYTDGAADASYDRMSFSSAASRARGLGMANALGVANGSGEDRDSRNGDRAAEEVRKDYEYKVASLTGRLGTLEDSLERRTREVQQERTSRERAEGNAEEVKKQLESFKNTLTQIRQELEETRAAYNREKDRNAALETSVAKGSTSAKAPNAVDDNLRLQVKDLVQELNSLSLQNDQLHTEADHQRDAVTAAEARAREMEKKWKAAKTELRNLKATSQMFVTAPRTNDHLPATKNGALADTHVTAFQTAIDGLITAARSTAPTSTLGAMKPVILAMADISRDVEMFESRSAALRADVDAGELAELKDRSTTTLNALTQAAKEFAMSYGLSPISLLDAAASEVAASVVGLFKLLGIRREKKDVDYRSEFAAMQEAASDGGSEEETSIQPAGRSHGPRPTHSRQSSEGSNYDVRDSTLTAKPSVSTPPSPGDGSDHADGQNHRLTSTSSVGSTNSAFNLERKASLAETDASSLGSQKGWGGGGSSNKPAWDSRPTNGFRSPFDHGDEDHEDDGDADGEQAWRQLRPYMDTQSESLISAIQTLLASVRSGSPATELRENLSSVIVIGSSIVGVTKDSLPLRAVGEGRRLLRALAGNCELLSQLSEGEDMGKDVRNQIASTTFELAKNLKSLLSL